MGWFQIVVSTVTEGGARTLRLDGQGRPHYEVSPEWQKGASYGEICGHGGQAEGTVSIKTQWWGWAVVMRDKTKAITWSKGAPVEVVGFEDGEEGRGQIVLWAMVALDWNSVGNLWRVS